MYTLITALLIAIPCDVDYSLLAVNEYAEYKPDKIWRVVVAKILISQAPKAQGATYQDFPEDLFNWVHIELQEEAVALELLEPRQLQWILESRYSRIFDLDHVRRLNEELKGAPSVGDALRFPEPQTASSYLQFNRDFWFYMEKHKYGSTDEGKQIIAYLDKVHKIWSLVQSAVLDGTIFIAGRRRALKDLRDVIGDEAYYSTQLPPHVPYWYFERLD